MFRTVRSIGLPATRSWLEKEPGEGTFRASDTNERTIGFVGAGEKPV